MKPVLITGGRVIDPAQGINEVSQVLLADGRINKLGTGIAPNSDYENVNAEGMVICPGFIDLHCHLRQPGYEYKETIASGTRAAAKGGFTTVCCMPNTDPPLDNGALIDYVKNVAAREGAVRVLPIGTITRGRKGEELANLAEMAAAGAVGFSDDGSYVASARVMRRAMDYTLPLGLPVIDHCEEPSLVEGGQINEGIIATRLGLAGIPGAAEEIAIARDITLAQLTGSRLHVAHVSSAGSLEIIRQAKIKGIRVTAEVTPHHLTLTEEKILRYNTQAKVNPPLRTARDIEALIAGLKDGAIDIIATDHAPHTENDKLCEFANAAFGISALETAFSSLMGLVHSGKLELSDLIAKLTKGPADVLGEYGKNLGSLVAGGRADVAIIDPEAEWTVDVNEFLSKGKNNPLDGEKLKGRVMMTFYGGKIVYRGEGI